MAIIQWDDSLSVNIGEIDAQHAQLIAFLNQLLDLMMQKAPLEAFKPVLDNLLYYTKSHFQTEERYFQQYGFPDTAPHVEEHREFIEKVESFYREFEEGNVVLSIEVMDFLKSWIENHIKGSDKKYSSFLNDRGIN